jgi:hypothetical protein
MIEAGASLDPARLLLVVTWSFVSPPIMAPQLILVLLPMVAGLGGPDRVFFSGYIGAALAHLSFPQGTFFHVES